MKVATEPWFSRADAGDGVWHVSEPFVDPFARCNIWIVPGSTHVLIVDTGMGLVSLRNAEAALFDRPVIAAATHYHFDHVGSLHEFPVRLAHRAGAELLADARTIGGALHRRGFHPKMWQAFLDAGYSLSSDDLLTALPCAGYDIDSYAVEPCPPTRVLDEGDVVDIGDRAFEVLHLPGHSPDSIGLFDRARGVLFSGDAVYDGPLLDGGAEGDVDRYVATMERLRALPVNVVHGGHEASFGRDRLVELCDGYIARAAVRHT
jgi:glyoxylase-like metal-dependent hydrolase (beta-lactamase superfamily II)